MSSMATSVNDIADFARILREQPEWADTVRSILLGQELLNLPRQFAEFAHQTNERLARLEILVTDFVQATNERLARLETDVADLKTGQARLETDVADLKVGQARLETDVADLKVGQARLETDVADLKVGQARLETDVADLKVGQARLETDVADLKVGQARLETDVADLKVGQARLETDVADLKVGQARLETDVADLKVGQARLEGTVGRLDGAELEREAHANIVNIASRGLGLNRTRVLQSKIIPRGPELQDAIDDAEERGIITADQGSHLELIDVIIAARNKSDGQECYVAVEVSAGIRDHDITRARDRAQTLATVMATLVIPAVVGTSIAPQQQALADREGVSVILTLRLAPPADEPVGNQAN